MMSPTFILLLLALAVVAAARLAIPLCIKRERQQQATTRAALKAAGSLKNRLRPGIYSFGWAKGQLEEPRAEQATNDTGDKKVVIRYFNDDQKTSDITKMPYQFQKEFLGQVHKALLDVSTTGQDGANQ